MQSKYLDKKKKNAKTLAQLAGLSPSALSKIEAGKQKLDFEEAMVIVGVLGISAEELITVAKALDTPALNNALEERKRLSFAFSQLADETVLRTHELIEILKHHR